MTDLVVIYDPTVELGAVIDVDTRQALPMAMVGEHARDILQAFVDGMPFDVTTLPPATIADVWQSFLEAAARTAAVAPDTDAQPPMEPSGSPDLDGAAQAVREAHDAAGAPPEPAPADPDLEADKGSQTVRVKCWNCNGTGTIEYGDNTPAQSCNMCHGAGTVEMTPA